MGYDYRSVERMKQDEEKAIVGGWIIGLILGVVFSAIIVIAADLTIKTWWVALGAVGFTLFIGYLGGQIGLINEVGD